VRDYAMRPGVCPSIAVFVPWVDEARQTKIDAIGFDEKSGNQGAIPLRNASRMTLRTSGTETPVRSAIVHGNSSGLFRYSSSTLARFAAFTASSAERGSPGVRGFLCALYAVVEPSM
jgi:hypothetical protein